MTHDDIIGNNPMIDPVDGNEDDSRGDILIKKDEHNFAIGEVSKIDEPEGLENKKETPRGGSKSDPDLSPEKLENEKPQLRFNSKSGCGPLDAKVIEQQQLIIASKPNTDLEIALYDEIQRKDTQIDRLTGEILKLKQFVSKRKQVYKRKRKDEGAPTRALSAYNIFVQDRFSRLARENEVALKSADSDAKLMRVPPARLVASTGNEWKELPPEDKVRYEERYVFIVKVTVSIVFIWLSTVVAFRQFICHRAKLDRKRYQEQMAEYQPPDKQSNKKRNKTGYNMFFSYHVNELKTTDIGVPSERGSVARMVGNAWKVSRICSLIFLIQSCAYNFFLLHRIYQMIENSNLSARPISKME